MARITAPRHLTRRSKVIYVTTATEYRLDREPHALEVLRLALESLDRGDLGRVELAKAGLTYTNRFGEPRPHPSVAIVRDANIAVARMFRELSLDAGEVLGESRLPRTSGATS
jgi:phage terminase small subunit